MSNHATAAPERATESPSSTQELPQGEPEPPAIKDITGIITLTVKPLGHKYFQAQRVPAAQFAGFEWVPEGRGNFNSLGLLDADTSRPLALIKDGKSSAEAFGKMERIQIEIDLLNGPLERRSGNRIMEACLKFATAMHGQLFDEDGELILVKKSQELECLIDESMKARLEAQFAAEVASRTKLPDGTLREAGAVSFNSTIYTARGRRKEERNFEVEPAGYYEGQCRGVELAREMFDVMHAHKQYRHMLNFECILRDAASQGGIRWDKESIGNVASSFLGVIEEMVVFAVQHCNYAPWLEKRADCYRKRAEVMAARDLAEKADFVERMRKARAAKKASAA